MARNYTQNPIDGLRANEQIPGDWDRVAGEGRGFPLCLYQAVLGLDVCSHCAPFKQLCVVTRDFMSSMDCDGGTLVAEDPLFSQASLCMLILIAWECNLLPCLE